MAFMLLLSSTGFAMDVHYCQDQLKSISLIGKAKSCHEKQETPPCHHKKDSLSKAEKDNCCHNETVVIEKSDLDACLLYTSPSPRDKRQYRMPSSA